MASLSVITDATIPLDISNWTQVNNKKTKKASSEPELEIDQSKYVKTKITVIMRVPNDKPFLTTQETNTSTSTNHLDKMCTKKCFNHVRKHLQAAVAKSV
jgi:hypothetical protein